MGSPVVGEQGTPTLANKTLKFYTDKSLNEFLGKAFQYFEELGSLEKMLPQEPQPEGERQKPHKSTFFMGLKLDSSP